MDHVWVVLCDDQLENTTTVDCVFQDKQAAIDFATILKKNHPDIDYVVGEVKFFPSKGG